MAGQLNINQLKQFAPQSPMLAFRPADTGSPMQDWCRHLGLYPNYRRELEEFAVVGDVVVRIADGIEPEPLDRVKILSLEYAVKVLEDETDAREFVRCVRAIASPDAGQFEYEQIAAYYYGEIRRRGAGDVLKEMGLLGMEMESVTATVADREISAEETAAHEQKLTVADQRRSREAAKNRTPLPPRTPNFDDEHAAVIHRVGKQKVARMVYDDFAEFLLDDNGKTIDELDADFLTFEKLQQYDENGVIGFSMNGGQHSVVVYDFETEVDASYLPLEAQLLAGEMSRLFVGHAMGGAAARKARQFVFAARVERDEINATRYGFATPATAIPPVDKFSDLPFSDHEFADWLGAKLDRLYDRRVVRTVRRITHNRAGVALEYLTAQEVNPDYEEMQHVAAVCQILWNRQRSDFHLRSLRHRAYQNLYMAIRKTSDTAVVAGLKKEAYGDFKERKTLSLKEFTALNTVAKSQEGRLANYQTPTARRLLNSIKTATANRLRFLKYSLYNDADIQSLTRQEKQRLWDAVRARETELHTPVQMELFRPQTLPKQVVKVIPVTA